MIITRTLYAQVIRYYALRNLTLSTIFITLLVLLITVLNFFNKNLNLTTNLNDFLLLFGRVAFLYIPSILKAISPLILTLAYGYSLIVLYTQGSLQTLFLLGVSIHQIIWQFFILTFGYITLIFINNAFIEPEAKLLSQSLTYKSIKYIDLLNNITQKGYFDYDSSSTYLRLYNNKKTTEFHSNQLKLGNVVLFYNKKVGLPFYLNIYADSLIAEFKPNNIVQISLNNSIVYYGDFVKKTEQTIISKNFTYTTTVNELNSLLKNTPHLERNLSEYNFPMLIKYLANHNLSFWDILKDLTHPHIKPISFILLNMFFFIPTFGTILLLLSLAIIFTAKKTLGYRLLLYIHLFLTFVVSVLLVITNNNPIWLNFIRLHVDFICLSLGLWSIAAYGFFIITQYQKVRSC